MRIGVVGLTTTSPTRITPTEHIANLTFLPPVQSLDAAVKKLRKEGAEAIIVLAHLSSKERKEWKDGVAPAIRQLAAVPGVNAVIYGHSHQEHLSKEVTKQALCPLCSQPSGGEAWP